MTEAGNTAPSGVFYLSFDCPQCDDEILYGPCLTTEEHQGAPVIPFDIAAQTTVRCPKCRTESYTGDVELYIDDDEEDEDDD